MCCQILQEDSHYAMNARTSILPDDKCYLLSEGLVNFNKVCYYMTSSVPVLILITRVTSSAQGTLCGS